MPIAKQLTAVLAGLWAWDQYERWRKMRDYELAKAAYQERWRAGKANGARVPVYGDGARPTGVITSTLVKERANQLKESWMAMFSGGARE